MNAGEGGDLGDGEAAYRPGRYRREVTAKKRRRLIRKILLLSCSILAIAIIGLALLGFFGAILPPGSRDAGTAPAQHQPATLPAASTPLPGETGSVPDTGARSNTTPSPTTGIVLGSGIPAGHEPGLFPLDAAISRIRLEYPERSYSVSAVNATERNGRRIYEFTIFSVTTPGDKAAILADLDAVTGDPYTSGQESARVPADQAKRAILAVFPEIKPDLAFARFVNSPAGGQVWIVSLVRDNAVIASGTVDADTGTLLSFVQTLPSSGRTAAARQISREEAQETANRTIIRLNGPLPADLDYGHLETAEDAITGELREQYTFTYRRIIQDYPCDTDGLSVSLDPETGKVIQYKKHWTDPENAFSVASEPLVIKREATYAILKKIQETSPSAMNTTRILSARLMWMDRSLPGQAMRPGSIPLAWKVTFDNDRLRAENPPRTAAGWVDSQTGAVIAVDEPSSG